MGWKVRSMFNRIWWPDFCHQWILLYFYISNFINHHGSSLLVRFIQEIHGLWVMDRKDFMFLNNTLSIESKSFDITQSASAGFRTHTKYRKHWISPIHDSWTKTCNKQVVIRYSYESFYIIQKMTHYFQCPGNFCPPCRNVFPMRLLDGQGMVSEFSRTRQLWTFQKSNLLYCVSFSDFYGHTVVKFW